MSKLLVVVSAVLLVAGQPPPKQRIPIAGNADELAAFALAGFKDARNRLRSGVYRARGHLDRSHKPVYPIEGTIELFSVFDFDEHLFRFERMEPLWIPAENTGKKRTPNKVSEVDNTSTSSQTPSQMRLGRSGGKLIRANQMSVQWRTRTRQAVLDRVDSEAAAQIREFDIRLVGWANWGTLDHNVSWDEGLRFLQQPVHDAVIEDDTLYRLTWIDNHGGYYFSLWIDSQIGFSPVRYEQRERGPDGEGPWPAPNEVGQARWLKRTDVWVPTWSYQERRSGHVEHRELNFVWDSVNEDIDRSMFTWEELGLPKGTSVIDYRFGNPKLIGGVGASGPRAIPFSAKTSLPALRKATAKRAPSRMWLFVILNAIILLGIIGVLLAKRKQHRQ